MNQIITFQVSYIDIVALFLSVAVVIALCFAISAQFKAGDTQDSIEELDEEQRKIEKRLTALEAKKDEEEKKI